MISLYFVLALLILGMNVVPILMPPTWTVLAFYVAKYHLFIIPAVLIGASCATLGRIILATLSRKYFRRMFSKKSQENYETLGNYLNTHEKITIPLVITYAFFPIPSNDVFIAAGLAGVNIKLLAGSFFVGRLISYSFWIQLTRHLADNLEDIFNTHYANFGAIAVEIAGLLIIYLIGKIAWRKIVAKLPK